jgi:hypothetical protein
MKNDIEIVVLTKKDLFVAIECNNLWENNIVALPKSKAQWLLKNDRIKDDDVCAVIGLENNRVIGYTLVIPDLIKTKNNIIEKAYWIHIWWVISQYDGHVLGLYIFNETVKLLNSKVLINSFLEKTNPFFEKGPFKIINKRERFTIFFNLESNILVGRFSFLKHFKWLINLTNSTIVNSINYYNNRKVTKRTANLSYEYINEIDEETWIFIEPKCQDDLTVKTKSYVNWQIDNSQYIQTPIAEKFRHIFSSTGYSSNIYSYSIKIYRDNEIIGFISYILNTVEFNIKYFLAKDDISKLDCVDALVEHFFQSNAKYIITDDKNLTNEIKNRYFTIFIYRIKKKTITHKDASLDFDDVLVTDRDGRFH